MIDQSILLHVQQSIYYTSSCGQSICNLNLILYPIILDLAALEDVVEELLVVLTQLPEEDEQLLVEVDLLLGAGQVGLGQRVHQQPRDARQDEGEVLLPVDPDNQLEVSIEVK